MEKTLNNTDISGARQNVPDIKVVGNANSFRLLCKASSQAEGWMKSTKAMEVPGGCVVQVTTQQKNPDGSYAVAEALTYVPAVQIVDDENNGRKLIQAVTVEKTCVDALQTLSFHMRIDPELAWGWHCNVAIASQDEGMSHEAANRAAARFMKMAFDVDTSRPPIRPTKVNAST